MSLRCYQEDLCDPAIGVPGRTVRLSEPEARHARLSRRLSAGDPIVLFDGKGTQAEATIAAVSRHVVEAAITRTQFAARPAPALTLAVAMPKGPRQDMLIEKCTELGTAAIQPLITERSVAGASEHKLEKWRRTTIEAAKQSGQCWLPDLLPPLPLADCRSRSAGFDLTLAAVLPREGIPVPMTALLDRITAARSVLAFVGPEGGWTDAEAQALLDSGALPVSLGPHTLRIETAAIALAALAHACAAPASGGR